MLTCSYCGSTAGLQSYGNGWAQANYPVTGEIVVIGSPGGQAAYFITRQSRMGVPLKALPVVVKAPDDRSDWPGRLCRLIQATGDGGDQRVGRLLIHVSATNENP